MKIVSLGKMQLVRPHTLELFTRVLMAALLILGLSACEEAKDDIKFKRSGELTNNSYDRIERDYPEFFLPGLLANRDGMDADGDRVCAYRPTGTTAFSSNLYLDCWGSETPRGDQVYKKATYPKALSIGSAHVCVSKTSHNGIGIYCEGANKRGQSINPDIGTSLSSGHYVVSPRFLTSGDQHNCVIDQFGIYCWGSNEFGQLDAPVVIDPIFIASAENHNCAIDSSQAVHCWGANEAGQTQVPSDLVNVYYLALGKDFSCALYGATEDTRSVTCWGNTQWTVPAPETMTGWDFINAGDDHVCAVDDDADADQVTCWGNNGLGQLDVPEQAQRSVYNLVSGNGFSCATVEYTGYSTTADDAQLDQVHLGAICWGSNSQGQLNVPSYLCYGYNASAKLADDRFCPALD